MDQRRRHDARRHAPQARQGARRLARRAEIEKVDRRLFYAWLLTTLLSGIPSTLHALVTGGDPLEATRAAGAMVGHPGSITAAATVHASISLFWTVVLWLALPKTNVLLWALLASAAIALLDLRIIAPFFFPEVAALAFWPQFADHLAWGACFALGFSCGRRARALRP